MKPEIPKSTLEALARQSAADEHPSADLLSGFVERALTSAEKERVLSHLAGCADCREVVFLVSGAQPEIRAVVQNQDVDTPIAAQRGWSGWKWFVPALATVVVASGVIVERHRLFPSAQPSVEVASAPRRPEATKTQPRQLRDNALSPPAASSPMVDKQKATTSVRDISKDALALDRRSTTANTKDLDVVVQAESSGKKEGKNEERYAVKAAKPTEQQMGGPVAPRQTPAQQSQQQLSAAAAPASPVVVGALKQKASGAVSIADEAAATPRRDKQSELAKASSKTDLDASYTASNVLQNTPNGGNDLTYIAPAVQKTAPSQQWRIADDGRLECSTGPGQWTRVAAVPGPLHSLAVVGNQVWAGGNNGVLFHSADGGAQWTQVSLSSGGQSEHGAIASIRFDTEQRGTVTTDSHATWSTADGGQTWAKQ